MRDHVQHHVARLDQREVILAVPAGHVGFAGQCRIAHFESLKRGGLICVKIHADFVDHIGATPERDVLAPVIRVAFQHDEPPGLITINHIGARGDRDLVNRGLGEIDPLPLCLLQNRAQTGQHDQFAVGFVERDADFVFASRFDGSYLAPEPGIAAMADCAQGLE